MTVSAPINEIRLCAWHGPDVDARNGRREQDDPEPCDAAIGFDEKSRTWRHEERALDDDHKAIFGRVQR